jgi:excinuclease ABC subunit B
VSATPGPWELEHSTQIVEQIVRPTGLLDPLVTIKPVAEQVSDVHQQILQCCARGERVMITTLTKKMAEDLAAYLKELGIKAQYLHSDLDTIERVELIEGLRAGRIDVLIGINLLREGLDVPEVALIAIFDADKEGFLRSKRSLIQTIGRAARHQNGRAILYADKITAAIAEALEETSRRRALQHAYNTEHHITPQAISKPMVPILDGLVSTKKNSKNSKQSAEVRAISSAPISLELLSDHKKLAQEIEELEKMMRHAASELKFDEAAAYRDRRAILLEVFKTL